MTDTPSLLPRPRELEPIDGPALVAPLRSTVRPDPSLPAQGYALRAAGGEVEIAHADAAGLRYAQALARQLEAAPGPVSALSVRDWPDFPVRGLMLDISRDRVPTRETLARLVDLLALFRLNRLELYTEHTFAYRDHEEVWRDASPITADDVRWLDALCAERGIELGPNQNCFGHMARWLAHEPYRGLAEAPSGWETRRGAPMPPGVLAPTDESFAFVKGLLDELLPNFSSRRVNINCDETFELGKGRSADDVRARGRGAVYMDFLARIFRTLHERGCEVLFWSDVLRSHPELIPALPARTTALVWHYEAPAEPQSVPAFLRELFAEFGADPEVFRGFEGQVPAFAEAGVPFWVCPGTSSWNSLVGRAQNARANLLDAAVVGKAHGAGGIMITDWGDNGHLQPFSISLPPLAYGGAVGWCVDANRDLDVAPLLDRLVFDDPSGTLGAALEAIGGVCTGTGLSAINASPLHTKLLLRGGMPLWGEVDPSGLLAVVDTLERASGAIGSATPRSPDAHVVQRELRQAIRLARHGAWRIAREVELPFAPETAALRADLAEAIEEQRACWLLRSRPGGLTESVSRLERTLETYSD